MNEMMIQAIGFVAVAFFIISYQIKQGFVHLSAHRLPDFLYSDVHTGSLYGSHGASGESIEECAFA